MAARPPRTAPLEAATSIIGPASGMATPDRHNLTAFRDAMNVAQQTALAARRPPADQAELHDARVAQLLAMSQYEQALTRCRLPIPQRLRQETQVLRRLLA